MQKDPLVISNKSCKIYFLLDGSKVYFSGDFDSGNLEKAEQISPYTYRITPGFDKTRQSTRNTYFHFKTFGFKHCTVRFIITRAYLLEQFLIDDEDYEVYHPVVKKEPEGKFQKIKSDVKIYYNYSHQPELSFSFQYIEQGWVEFAFSYPYSYEDNEIFIKKMKEQYQKHYQIYFYPEVLCRTSQHRKVHVITITDKRNCKIERQGQVEGLFGETPRPFKIDKPIIVISARVHPGETPASYCMQGVIRFLLNQKDYRSYLLRKNFHFILIPMLNPEGVYEGMFRNDVFGENLNRMYLYCDPRKHKSIWSVKKYLESLKKVDFFFDLHAHPSRKGFFIYGNAFDEFVYQVEAQIFSKMIEYNCPYFQNLDCIYSQKAMVAKDKHDNYNKQGCARVFYYKLFKLVHSFTVQCGYFAPGKLNPYPPQRQFTIPGSDYVCTTDWQNSSKAEYTPQNYMLLGKSILISIIDLFHINPYTRIGTSDFKSINSLRKFTAQKVYNEVQRFRLIDAHCVKKIKGIATFIEQSYFIPRFKQFGLTISENYGMRHRKKTFSLNSRVYVSHSVKSLVKENIIKNVVSRKQQPQCQTPVQIKSQKNILPQEKRQEKQQSLQKIHVQIMNEERLIKESYSQAFSKVNKVVAETNKKPKFIKGVSLELIKNKHTESQKILNEVQESMPIYFGKSYYGKQDKSLQLTPTRKIQMELINEFLQTKLKNQSIDSKRPSEMLVRIDRLGSFLKKQNKNGIRFPSIHPVDRFSQDDNVK